MSKAPRIPPKQNQLDEMLGQHLSFEINRFRIGVSMWGEQKYGEVPDAMIRESCLIHMRLLLDFFYPRTDPTKKSKYEDVFATDYLPDVTQLSEKLQKLLMEPIWLQDYRNQLDWRLAHLTMKRFDFAINPVWQPEKQFKHMERLISEFLSALPEKTRALFSPHRQGSRDIKQAIG
jgi:hypothetical protein